MISENKQQRWTPHQQILYIMRLLDYYLKPYLHARTKIKGKTRREFIGVAAAPNKIKMDSCLLAYMAKLKLFITKIIVSSHIV